MGGWFRGEFRLSFCHDFFSVCTVCPDAMPSVKIYAA